MDAPMSLMALLVAANVAVVPPATLILERIRSVDDPRSYDLRDQVNGDRGVPKSCALSENTTVTLSAGKDATLEVDRGGTKKTIVVEDVRGLGRSTLACGGSDTFFYANPRHGRLYAYSASRLFHGEDPVEWTRGVEPFTSLDDANGVMTEASIATVVQARQNLVLIEWFFRKHGETGFWHEVVDGATGAELAKLGPSDLLVKTNEHDPWWIVFQGGGNETANYVPQGLYRLQYGSPVDGAKPAAATIEVLRAQTPPARLKAVAKLSPNPVINHMIALLSPTRTTLNPTIEFCPAVPGQRARYWLGSDYDEMLATLARNILLAFWAERQKTDASANPIDEWFHSEIAPTEPMKTLLAQFNPGDDQWIAQYQQALLQLGEPTFNRLFASYATATGAVVRTPIGKGTR
jgi:hypothetical protein